MVVLYVPEMHAKHTEESMAPAAKAVMKRATPEPPEVKVGQINNVVTVTFHESCELL
jgi:hypothetical protein